MSGTIIYSSKEKLSETTPAAIECKVRRLNNFDCYTIALTDCGKTSTLSGDVGTTESTEAANKRIDILMGQLTKLKEYINTYR